MHGRLLQIRRSIYMQSNPRISVNLLVISVKILVHLPVKLTNFGRTLVRRAAVGTSVVSYLDGDLVLLDLLTSLGSRFIYRIRRWGCRRLNPTGTQMLHDFQRRLLRRSQDNTMSKPLQREQLDAMLLCTLARRNHSFGSSTSVDK